MAESKGEEIVLISSESEGEREKWEAEKRKTRKKRARKKKCCDQVICFHADQYVKPEKSQEQAGNVISVVLNSSLLMCNNELLISLYMLVLVVLLVVLC